MYYVTIIYHDCQQTTYDFKSYIDTLNKYYDLRDNNHDVYIELRKGNKILCSTDAIHPINNANVEQWLKEDI